jgi:hypothetical protein
MKTQTTIIEQAAPAVAASYVALVHTTYNALVQKMGGTNMKGIYNRREIFTFRAIEACINKEMGAWPENSMICTIDETKLAAAAAAHAEATVAEWAAKITAKMGELDTAEVAAMGSTSFSVSGTKNGKRVHIEQTMIINVSSRGILFNQFPALIYVEGKKTPASKFGAAVA